MVFDPFLFVVLRQPIQSRLHALPRLWRQVHDGLKLFNDLLPLGTFSVGKELCLGTAVSLDLGGRARGGHYGLQLHLQERRWGHCLMGSAARHALPIRVGLEDIKMRLALCVVSDLDMSVRCQDILLDSLRTRSGDIERGQDLVDLFGQFLCLLRLQHVCRVDVDGCQGHSGQLIRD